MDAVNLTQKTIIKTALDDYIGVWAEAFLRDRKAQSKTDGTIKYYRDRLRSFLTFCETRALARMGEITADELRAFLLYLQDSGHNTGGVHSSYRALKAFLNWFEDEAEPPNWKNPIKKVKAPKLAQALLEPAALADVEALIKVCSDDFLGLRDAAIFITLLDTGARAAELLALDLSDVNLVTGEVSIRHGKGDKGRTVFLGKAARKYLRRYQTAHPGGGAVFVTQAGERLTYDGLRGVVARRAKAAGIEPPKIHAFRRAFALNCLRAGMDVYSLQRLMGHADLQVLRRYLAQTTDDLQAAHGKFAPGDRLKRR